MDKPLTKATLKTINRFPELYKRQAYQMLFYERGEAVRITADSFVMASVLALIEAFGFGTLMAHEVLKPQYATEPEVHENV